ncbi:radical SAM family heme chaperone HemW [Paenisporosarcina sp. TG20]|uniref:radical SAM family heme chaperone HemW n=1 Tax=Paenisporosarcina sp. TG20 TaxID=1211706 RepID=UPI0003124270|nr:radical SAM family heme chaperone HemW [Paenisporosarcina sp. TG20]
MIKGAYIHIPFCHQICHYCDFNKVFFKNQPVDAYIEALGMEMKMFAEKYRDQLHIETIFLGGGTPTALSSEQLQRLFELIDQYIPKDNLIEFSSEANPDELTVEKLMVMKSNGINRLSIGVQSFDEDILLRLGRTHSNDHVYKTIQMAKDIGFTNISIDLMYGLPGQTMDQWKDTLNKALELDLHHYSAYSLIVEPKTVFYNLMTRGKLILPGEDMEADMYEELMTVMKSKDIHQYEISNFAHIDYHSRHNNLYWDNVSYAGFGAGAHGYVKGIRYANIGPIKKYINAVEMGDFPINTTHEVTADERMEEEMFLGLRKVEGVNKIQFEEKFGVSMQNVYGQALSKHISSGSLVSTDDAVALTRKGRFIGNEIFQSFLMK